MLQCRISIKINEYNSGREWTIDKVNSCEVFKSADRLLDSCKIELPLGIRWNGQPEIPEFEKSSIEVKMGYDERLETVFKGYVMYLQTDTKLTIWSNGELAKSKYKTLPRENNRSGFPFTDILWQCGIEEQIISDMKDRPWYYELTGGTVFGLLEHLKRLHIHATQIYDENGKALIVLTRRYVEVLDKGITFEYGKNIIDFKDTLIKNDTEDDVQYNINATIVQPVYWGSQSEYIDPDLHAEIAIIHPEWRGRKIDLTFWGTIGDEYTLEEADDAAIRACVIRGQYELAKLTTFGANFVQPFEKVTVKWLQQEPQEFIVISNQISYGLGGIRQILKLF